jgi:hypothetical protein
MALSSSKIKDCFRFTITFLIITAILFLVHQSRLFEARQYLTSNDCENSNLLIDPNRLLGIYGDITNQYQTTDDDGNSSIDSDSVSVKRLFTQGMIQLYGYNREEAERNFRAAVKLDPLCGACFVGIVLANGPTINNHVEEHHVEAARKAIIEAHNVFTSKPLVQTKFKALLEAQSIRFSNSTKLWIEKGQHHFNMLYSSAMKRVYNAHSFDDDIAAMYADSLMLLSPWDYFIPTTDDVSSNIHSSMHSISIRSLEDLKPHMQVAYTVLSSTLKRNPKHLLALPSSANLFCTKWATLGRLGFNKNCIFFSIFV